MAFSILLSLFFLRQGDDAIKDSLFHEPVPQTLPRLYFQRLQPLAKGYVTVYRTGAELVVRLSAEEREGRPLSAKRGLDFEWGIREGRT